MSEVAAVLELDPGYVEGVATFYSLFHLEPIGKHRFYVCTNLSCALRGADEIVERVKQQIGVASADQVSSDGVFSYEEVECLGACEYAPMMRLDRRYYYDLTAEKVDALIAERRSSSPLTPALSPEGERGRRSSSPLTPTLSPEGERGRRSSSPLTPTLSPEGERGKRSSSPLTPTLSPE